MSKQPVRKQARLDCFLRSNEPANNGDRTVATTGTSEDAGTIMPATSSAATIDDAPLDAAARVDIAHVLELRKSKRLTLGEKIRLHSTVLRVPQSYQLPMQETTKEKFYLRHHHLSGGGNAQYEDFYFSPELQGVLCLSCLL